ncbi:MAG TPA: hypothetical protein VH305_07500, partial [Gaiella sp.]
MRARSGRVLALVVFAAVVLHAAVGAGSAAAAPQQQPPQPWQAFDTLDSALFDAELAATTNDGGALGSAGRRAVAAADDLAAGFGPAARTSALRLRRA